MKLFGWNCRGICSASAVQALKAQIKGARPDLIFLSKTKASISRMEFVKSATKFNHLFAVEAKGRAGGLCILWKDGLSVKVWIITKILLLLK